MTWNPAEHSDDDNLRWCWLRAVEWGRWPVFLSQPLAPVLLVWCPWQAVLLGVTVTNLVWAVFVRYRFVHVDAAYFGAEFARATWPAWAIATLWLFHAGRTPERWVSLAWPVLIFLLGAFTPTLIGRIQVRFMDALGYEPTDGNPLSSYR